MVGNIAPANISGSETVVVAVAFLNQERSGEVTSKEIRSEIGVAREKQLEMIR